MAFFDNKNQTAFFNNNANTNPYAQVQKPVSELDQLIEAEQAVQQEQFIAIGKKYYEEHLNDHEEMFAGEFEIINQSNAKIDAKKAEIDAENARVEAENKAKELREKGLKLCSKCNAEIPLNSIFCNICGAKINSDVVDEAVTAPVVISPYETRDEQTPVITPVNPWGDAQAEVKEEPAAVNPWATSSVQDNEEKQCPNCHSAVATGLKFCTNCGTNLDDAEIPVVPVVEEESPFKKCSVCGNDVRKEAMFCTHCGNKF